MDGKDWKERKMGIWQIRDKKKWVKKINIY